MPSINLIVIFIFVVDGVSCIGAVDVDINKDKIDVLVSGSQKQLCYLQD